MSLTFIAESCMNYNGNFGLLHELIKQFCKVDIAKFQLDFGEMRNDDTIKLILKKYAIIIQLNLCSL